MKTPFLSLFALSLLTCAAFANSYKLISLSGDSANAERTLTFDAFSLPRINDAGHVAFEARFEEGTATGESNFDAVLLYDATSPTILVRNGQLTTIGDTSYTFSSIRSVALTGNSRAAFIATLSSNQELLLSGSLSGSPASQSLQLHTSTTQQPIVDFNGGLDATRRYQIFGNPNGGSANAFSFLARLRNENAADATGYWLAELPSDAASSLRLVALGDLAPKGGSLVIDTPSAFSINDSLHGVLRASLFDGDELENNNEHGLWLLDATSAATRIAKTGDTAPSSTDPFLSFGKPSIDGSGKAFFWASLLNASAEEGLYLYSEGSLFALASTAQPINIFGTDRSYSSFMDPVVNGNGDLAVLATHADGSGHSILSRSAKGEWSIVAYTGMQAPGTSLGVVLETLSLPWLNDSGQIAFQASLSGSGVGISDTTDSGIWAQDANGVIALVIREGDTFEVKPGFPATLNTAEIGGFNSARELALRTSFTNGAKAIAVVGVENVEAPSIAAGNGPQSQTSYVGETIALEVEANGQGPFTYTWTKDGIPISGATNQTLELSNLSAGDNGDYSVTVSSSAGSVVSAAATITVQNVPNAPVFVEEPLGDIALRGEAATLDARAISNTSVNYQWFFRPVGQSGEFTALSGQTSEVMTINPADTANEGTYYALATSEGGSTHSAHVEILVTDRRLTNVSARARIGTGDNVLIAGFVISGSEPKQVLIRGIGPGLPESVEDRLLRPRLQLYRRDPAEGGGFKQTLIQTNEGWESNANADEIQTLSIGVGSELKVADDTAMLVTLQPGFPYTAIVSSVTGIGGVGLAEVFEVDQDLVRMINISARAPVGTGSDVVIPGFVVHGDEPLKVLIRAVGPSLAKHGVSGLLEFPSIEVYQRKQREDKSFYFEPIAYNDGWLNLWDPQEIVTTSALVGAQKLDEGSEDAAMVMELQPGVYTVKTAGENGTTGNALVEIYAVP